MTLASDHDKDRPSLARRWIERLGERPDETILRWGFRGLIAATVVVVGLDLHAMIQAAPAEDPALDPTSPVRVLPTTRPDETADPAMDPEAVDDLHGVMRFELIGGNRLLATGLIEPGAAERFAREVELRGEYIEIIELASSGGSVLDALTIGRRIRELGATTEIRAGSYCASSCPLVFSGGVERRAAAGAAIGVHQISRTGSDPTVSPADVMEEAQRVSADVQTYLTEMDIDARVWVHAMRTPPDELFYFSPDELIELNLATEIIQRN